MPRPGRILGAGAPSLLPSIREGQARGTRAFLKGNQVQKADGLSENKDLRATCPSLTSRPRFEAIRHAVQRLRDPIIRSKPLSGGLPFRIPDHGQD